MWSQKGVELIYLEIEILQEVLVVAGVVEQFLKLVLVILKDISVVPWVVVEVVLQVTEEVLGLVHVV